MRERRALSHRRNLIIEKKKELYKYIAILASNTVISLAVKHHK